MNGTRVFAPAKVNLTLQIGRPRVDGMHPLQSVVGFASVGDWIDAAPAQTLSLQIVGPFAAMLPLGSDNLVLRAAKLLAGTGDEGAALTLTKNLPIASGIGGGSTDAAAALKACSKLWRRDWDDLALATLAAPLGSDVPACITARACFLSGTGASVTPLDLPALDAVLVNPRLPLATASVYREFDRMGLGADFAETPAPEWRDRAAAIEAIARIGNDLAAPARALMPSIDVMMDALRADKRALVVSLSGSGASVFALVENGGNAQALASDLSKRHTNWWIAPARLA